MKNKTSVQSLFSWFFFWPFILSYKAFRWGWARNKAVTIAVTAMMLLIGAIGSAAKPVPVDQEKQVNLVLSDGSIADKKASPETNQTKNSTPIAGELKVHFIDVGQADSILVQAPNGKVMLIDAGNNGDAGTVANYLKNQGVGKIDILIGTHPHEDHVGGLDTVINQFDIGSIYMPKVSNNTKTYEDVLTAIKNKGLKVSTAAAGIILDLSEGVRAEILAPNGTGYKDLNNYSAVVKLIYGNTSFLLAGDAEDISEREMLAKGYDLKADVLKVGHHGSSSSTTQEFLDRVKPLYAVITVGLGNDYGHPHKPTMQRLQKEGIKVYRTDQNGTITAISDGNNIAFNTEPGNYSYNGE